MLFQKWIIPNMVKAVKSYEVSSFKEADANTFWKVHTWLSIILF